MKIKRSTKSADRLVALLKKETIVHLNPEEMFKGMMGNREIRQVDNLTPLPGPDDSNDQCPPTTVPTDSGLTPFCAI